MELKLIFYVCVSIALASVDIISADSTDATKNSTTPTNTTIADHAIVDTASSKLCKKCICDIQSKVLDCTNQTITKWFDDKDYETLQYGNVLFDTIRLEHNNLTEIPVIKQIPVKNLYLNYNKIKTIANRAFYSLGNLEVLNLAHNQLESKSLIPEVFEGPYKPAEYEPLPLKELDLGYNELHTLDSDIFEHFTKLQTLILGGNVFQAIDPASEIAISGITNLETLDLSYMELDDLPDHLLHSPRNLKTLILTGNLFDEIPEALTYAINLESINLDENPIESLLGENVFPKLTKVKTVSMSYIPHIVEIGKGAFGKLSNLNQLSMTYNPQLSFIHPEAFVNLNKSIIGITEKTYPPVKEIYLHNNNLTVLERELFERWDNIQTIDIQNNPWRCDCKNKWMIYSLLKQIEGVNQFLTKNVKCYTPDKWNGMRIQNFAENVELQCTIDGCPIKTGIFLDILIVILVAICVFLCFAFAYRRGYFRVCGSRFGNNNDTNRTLYNKANFHDDYHI